MARIAVHHHFYPEVFTKGGDPSGWTIPPWTLEADQQLAQEIGIQSSILSITAPGDCLKEIAYALDHLKANGVILFTRYGKDNHYLGHPDFQPNQMELNSRKAVVFIHPTHAVDTNFVNIHLPQPMFDYPHETGRTTIDMVPQVKNCKIILSHAGGTLPYLIDRVASTIPYTGFSVSKSTQEIRAEAKEFYFDTASSGVDLVIDLLLGFAKEGHTLFGSDFPNAVKLFPRLRKV